MRLLRQDLRIGAVDSSIINSSRWFTVSVEERTYYSGKRRIVDAQ